MTPLTAPTTHDPAPRAPDLAPRRSAADQSSLDALQKAIDYADPMIATGAVAGVVSGIGMGGSVDLILAVP